MLKIFNTQGYTDCQVHRLKCSQTYRFGPSPVRSEDFIFAGTDQLWFLNPWP